jgi:hypothetical protein
MNKPMGDMSKTCNCTHHKIVPWAIILIGFVIFVSAFNLLTSMAQMIVIGLSLVVIGGTKLSAHKCNCCNADKRMKM